MCLYCHPILKLYLYGVSATHSDQVLVFGIEVKEPNKVTIPSIFNKKFSIMMLPAPDRKSNYISNCKYKYSIKMFKS
jgi:hypothetical protein